MLTQSEIIDMAREAGLKIDGDYFSDDLYRAVLTRFAKLVAAKEREVCADLCYQLVDNSRETRFASAIRARGQQ